MVAHAFNPALRRQRPTGLSSRPACSVYRVTVQHSQGNTGNLSEVGWGWKNPRKPTEFRCTFTRSMLFLGFDKCLNTCSVQFGISDVAILRWSSWSSAQYTVIVSVLLTANLCLQCDQGADLMHDSQPVPDLFKLVQNKSGHRDLKLFVVLLILKIYTFFSFTKE